MHINCDLDCKINADRDLVCDDVSTKLIFFHQGAMFFRDQIQLQISAPLLQGYPLK